MTTPKQPATLDDAAMQGVQGGSNGTLPPMLTGTDGQDWIIGSDASEVIETGGEMDMVHGGGGDDLIDGGEGDDLLVGNEGRDVLFGGAGDDGFLWMVGDGNDVVRGGAGHDTLLLGGFGMSRADLMALIVVDEGSPLPSLQGDAIDLTGVRGTLVIGEERITFEGLEQLRLVHW